MCSGEKIFFHNDERLDFGEFVYIYLCYIFIYVKC